MAIGRSGSRGTPNGKYCLMTMPRAQGSRHSSSCVGASGRWAPTGPCVTGALSQLGLLGPFRPQQAVLSDIVPGCSPEREDSSMAYQSISKLPVHLAQKEGAFTQSNRRFGYTRLRLWVGFGRHPCFFLEVNLACQCQGASRIALFLPSQLQALSERMSVLGGPFTIS